MDNLIENMIKKNISIEEANYIFLHNSFFVSYVFFCLIIIFAGISFIYYISNDIILIIPLLMFPFFFLFISRIPMFFFNKKHFNPFKNKFKLAKTPEAICNIILNNISEKYFIDNYHKLYSYFKQNDLLAEFKQFENIKFYKNEYFVMSNNFPIYLKYLAEINNIHIIEKFLEIENIIFGNIPEHKFEELKYGILQGNFNDLMNNSHVKKDTLNKVISYLKSENTHDFYFNVLEDELNKKNIKNLFLNKINSFFRNVSNKKEKEILTEKVVKSENKSIISNF